MKLSKKSVRTVKKLISKNKVAYKVAYKRKRKKRPS